MDVANKKQASRVSEVRSGSLRIVDATSGVIRGGDLIRLVPFRGSFHSSKGVKALRLRGGWREVGRDFRGGDGDLDASE